MAPASVLVVGTVAYDTVKTPFGSAARVLGGSASYFTAASSLLAPTHLVSVVGGDFDLKLLDPLRTRGVDLSGLEVRKGSKTFHWSGEYHYDLNSRTTLATDLNVLTEFEPKVPPGAQKAPFVFLANIDPDLQLAVLDQVKGPRLVAADTMNFWIQGKPDALEDVLKRIDVLVINEEEARELADTPSLVGAARELLKRGPETVLVKKGEHGAVLAHRDEWFVAPAHLLADVRDPTGAGDSFAGGFIGQLANEKDLSHDALRRAVVVGSACASIVIEDFGPNALFKAAMNDVAERARTISKFARFPELW